MSVDRIFMGTFQGLTLKIYASIWDFKNRIRIWGMLSDGESLKASGCYFSLL